MAGTALDLLIGRFRVAARIQELGERGDAELLGLFARQRDEAAFELLLRRYGPMVMGVCTRILRHPQDAEDAFQATFLLLAERATRLREPGGVGNWLYGVARRTALEARLLAARRRAKERQAPPRAEWPPDLVRDEALAVLDEELAALPAVYRTAVLLCDLAGKTRAQAAAHLGCAAGTVASRLARGRALLARRLARRGITLPALTAVLAGGVASHLVRSTARMAVLLGAARGAAAVAPPAVVALMTGASKMVVSNGMKLILIVVFASTLTLGAVAVSSSGAGSGRTTAAAAVHEAGPAPGDTEPPARESPPTPAERLARLKAEYEAEANAATEDVKDPKSGKVVSRQMREIPADRYLPRLLELGRVDDEATAVGALSLALVAWPTSQAADEAFDLLLKRFAGSPRLAEFVREYQRHWHAGKEKRLERIVAEAKDRTAVGLALLQLAESSDPNAVRILGEKPDQEDARREKALALYRRVVSDFPAIEDGRPADLARRCVTRLQQLRAGLAAPSLAGQDLDGKRMTLADFKGKVVVLDFWGSWCGPCRRKLPLLKDVAARYADKGVVFLGVMAEDRAEDAARVVAQEKVPWRNWLDLRDEKGESPIVRAWGVVGFPSVYVLDGEGKIRFTRVLEQDELERALDQLLAEQAAPGKE
jgi:RNA polymerase sigma factor (sigma-70 family)